MQRRYTLRVALTLLTLGYGVATVVVLMGPSFGSNPSMTMVLNTVLTVTSIVGYTVAWKVRRLVWDGKLPQDWAALARPLAVGLFFAYAGLTVFHAIISVNVIASRIRGDVYDPDFVLVAGPHLLLAFLVTSYLLIEAPKKLHPHR